MIITPELAEISGMFAADGSLQEEHICMWGNITEDREYYDTIVCPLFSKVFNKKVIAHEKKSNSVYGFYICDKEIIKIFKELGFSRNKTYTVKTPKQILEGGKEIQKAFIRGFADGDGCFSLMIRKGKYSEFKRKFNTYPRISINVISQTIINEISSMLNELKIKHTKYVSKSYKPNEKDQYKIMIRGPEKKKGWVKQKKFL